MFWSGSLGNIPDLDEFSSFLFFVPQSPPTNQRTVSIEHLRRILPLSVPLITHSPAPSGSGKEVRCSLSCQDFKSGLEWYQGRSRPHGHTCPHAHLWGWDTVWLFIVEKAAPKPQLYVEPTWSTSTRVSKHAM